MTAFGIAETIGTFALAAILAVWAWLGIGGLLARVRRNREVIGRDPDGDDLGDDAIDMVTGPSDADIERMLRDYYKGERP